MQFVWYNILAKINETSDQQSFSLFGCLFLTTLYQCLSSLLLTLSGIIIGLMVNYIQINLAMQKSTRRECFLLGQCILFNIFETTNNNITQKHAKASQFICNQGIKVLQNITSEYLKGRNKSQNQAFTFQANHNTNHSESKPILSKKELVSEPSQLSFTQTKKYPSFQIKSQLKQRDSSFMPQKSKKKRLTQAEELRQSLKKLELQDKSLQNYQNEQEQEQNITLVNYQSIKNKTLAELIQESNKKIEERNVMNGVKHKQDDCASDSSYPITEYSSNQSSNQNEYDQEIREESSFSKNHAMLASTNNFSYSSIGSSVYEPMKLMYSPKKSKSKAKRTYIRNKKIPRWAQDIQKVKQEVIKQKQDPRAFDPSKIYGVCYVEKLDTNVIFNSESIYHRGSSAKWNRYPYNQFIE